MSRQTTGIGTKRSEPTDETYVTAYTMPNPRKLKVGDRVRFVSLPDEWRDAENTIPRESVEFMEVMIARSWPSRVYEVDEYGTPWIAARIRKDGKVEHHTWGIMERTGWRIARGGSC